MTKSFKGYWLVWLLSTGLLASTASLAQGGGLAEDRRLATGTEVSVHRFAALGDRLLIWLPSEHGHRPQEEMLAAALAKRGVEVWLPDLLTAHFLSPVPSSMLQIPAADVAALIRDAAETTGKTVYILSAGRGAVPLLRGVVASSRTPAGIILLYPNLYRGKPEPGAAPEYIEAVSRVRVPVVVVQPGLSPFAWWLQPLSTALQRGGATVKIIKLDGIRNRYYFRPDATVLEEAIARQLPVLLADLVSPQAAAPNTKEQSKCKSGSSWYCWVR